MLDEDHRKSLSVVVRARRESIIPDTPGHRRRTPGLRREELAGHLRFTQHTLAEVERGDFRLVFLEPMR